MVGKKAAAASTTSAAAAAAAVYSGTLSAVQKIHLCRKNEETVCNICMISAKIVEKHAKVAVSSAVFDDLMTIVTAQLRFLSSRRH